VWRYNRIESILVDKELHSRVLCHDNLTKLGNLSFTAVILGIYTVCNAAVRYAGGILRELTKPGKDYGRQVPLYESKIGFRLRDVVAAKP
jgi:hypothetical protein